MSLRRIKNMTIATLAAAVLAVATLWPPLAMATSTFRVDDSGSQVLGNTVQMKWDSVAPQRGERPTVSGAITVLVRLDLAQWQGSNARIYMTLPAQAAGPVTATWTTQGRLLPGILRAGERALVYAGVMPTALLEDTMRLVIQADGQKLVRTEQLNFAFEIDLEGL
ncbi:MAG: hypothetical protein WKF61_02970 [Luteimonas sp.]